jgi:hypothetical protein
MAEPVKSPSQLSWKRARKEVTTPKRLLLRPASVAVNNITVRSNLATFLSAFGSLKGKDVFGGDAAEFQQDMREEWQ